MKRVYRLLRNNRESGPYTIDELLGQKLRPADMLWIEGRSTAWSYLSEIELFPSSEHDASSKEISDEKNDIIESRADEIRRKVMNFKPQPLPVREERGEHGEMHYYVPVTPADTIEIVDHRKQKNSMFSDVLMTLLIVALFAGGLYGGRSLYLPKKHTQATELQSVSKEDEHAAKTIIPEVKQPVAGTPPADSTAIASSNKPKPVKKRVDTSLSGRITNITVGNNEMVEATEQPVVQAADSKEKNKDTDLVKKVKPISISGDEIAKDDTQEKKQGLFRKIFGKKKRDRDDN